MLMQAQTLSQSTQLKLEEITTEEAPQISTTIIQSPIRVSEENTLEINLKIQHSARQKTLQRHRKRYEIKNTKVSEGLKVTLTSKQIEVISKLLQKYAQRKQSQKQQSLSKLSFTQPSKQNMQVISKSCNLNHYSKDFFNSFGKRGKNVNFSQVIAVKKFRKDDYIEGLQFLPERYEGLNYLYKERQRQDLLIQRAQRIVKPKMKQKSMKKQNALFLSLCAVVLQKGEKEKLLS